MGQLSKISFIYRNATGKLVVIALVSSIGAMTNGFDSNWWGGVLGETIFNKSYGDEAVTTSGVKSFTLSTTQTAIGTGTSAAGQMIGNLIANPIAARFGRKKGLLACALVTTIGVILQATSSTGYTGRWGQLVAGKVITSLSVGMGSNIVPIYQAEVAPHELRGAMVSMYAIIQGIAAWLATVTIWQVNTWTTSAGWLVPICVQFAMPILIVLTYPLIPETPRWLVSQGRDSEALAVLQSMRPASFNCDAELQEMRTAYAEQAERVSGVKLFDVFKGKELRRTLAAIGVQCLGNAQGVGYIVSYIVVLLIQLGIQQSYLILQVIYLVYFLFSFTALWVPDVSGRRPLLMGGAALCAIGMLSIGAITTAEPSPTGAKGKAVVVMAFVWIVGYCTSFGPITWLLPAEISSGPLREMTMMVSSFCGNGVNLIINYVSPYIQDVGYGDLGGKIGYIWGGFSVVAIVFVYFFVPETRGRSLDELDYMFEHRVPTLKFGSYVFDDNENVTNIFEKGGAPKNESAEDVKV